MTLRMNPTMTTQSQTTRLQVLLQIQRSSCPISLPLIPWESSTWPTALLLIPTIYPSPLPSLSLILKPSPPLPHLPLPSIPNNHPILNHSHSSSSNLRTKATPSLSLRLIPSKCTMSPIPMRMPGIIIQVLMRTCTIQMLLLPVSTKRCRGGQRK